MSSDYRPRSGGSGSGGGESGGSRGGRRRRGGRGRTPSGGSHSEHRSHTNGHSAPKKKETLIDKFLGLFKSKKKTDQAVRPSTPRPEFKPREERNERVERTDRPERTERPRHEDRPPKDDPTPQEIVSPKLYVGNLAYEAAESDLFDLFSKVGAVKNVEVAMDRRSGRSKGFGFVEMEELDSAKAAAEKLNRTDFMGRQIVVSGAKVDKRPTSSREESSESSDAASESEAGGNPESTI
jgi:RNA recognition motif-containing protein